MALSTKLKFIMIDDDSITLYLVERIIKSLYPDYEVNTFTQPELALEYLVDLKTEDFKNLIVFIDLNMPVLNGWDVLDKLKVEVGDQLHGNAGIYILSSSDMLTDIDKSKKYKMVKGYLTKPLKILELRGIVDSYNY